MSDLDEMLQMRQELIASQLKEIKRPWYRKSTTVAMLLAIIGSAVTIWQLIDTNKELLKQISGERIGLEEALLNSRKARLTREIDSLLVVERRLLDRNKMAGRQLGALVDEFEQYKEHAKGKIMELQYKMNQLDTRHDIPPYDTVKLHVMKSQQFALLQEQVDGILQANGLPPIREAMFHQIHYDLHQNTSYSMQMAMLEMQYNNCRQQLGECVLDQK